MRRVMKLTMVWLTVGAVCLAVASMGVAQQTGGAGKEPGSLPDEVCKAIEQYIAGIDSARTARDKAERDGKYAAAQQALAPVLTRSGKASLLAEITMYAQQSELVAAADPTDANFEKLVAQRLSTRSKLLGWCSSFTPTR
jgi:hypothetical protein